MKNGSMRGTRVAGTAFLFILMTALLAACGGGGGGGYQPPPTPPPASASLSYPAGAQTFVVGTAITPITPTITGTLASFTVSPALPAGLALDPNKGTVSGTPTAIAAAATYTISAMPSGGTSVSSSLSITVNDVAPSQISYGASRFTFSANIASSTLTPKAAGGTVVSWSINPALPAGLTFSTADGSISGTPSTASAFAPYVVTAQNTGGQSTATLTLEVDAGPLITLGHQSGVVLIRASAHNVLSFDDLGHWILWDYTGASVVAQGNSGCRESNTCILSPSIDLAGSTAANVTPTGLEVHSTTDGRALGTITTSATWWKLASDGSYIAAGSKSSLSAWSPSGQLLFSKAGDYSQAVAFATPTAVLVGGGPAGQSVVETTAVPGGTATTGPAFNGQFRSWFVDGQRFITVGGTTALVYSKDSVQLGSIASVPATATVTGQGNWVWTYPNTGAVLNVYPATASNPAPAASYTLSSQSTAYASGTTVGVVTQNSTALSVIDLSGSAPNKTDYTAPFPINPVLAGLPITAPYAAVSASQWLVGTQNGVLLDGPTLASTPRYFGFGQAWSIAGGTGHFAIATASGTILIFNSATLAQENAIAFAADKVVMSSDGTVLVARGTYQANAPVKVYALPTGQLQYTWPASAGTSTYDIVLSGSGTVLAQVLFTEPGASMVPYYTQEAGSTTGGSQSFSSTFTALTSQLATPPIRLSPDGTLIGVSQWGSPITSTGTLSGTSLYQNGNLVTAFSGLPAGWLDNGRLLVNNYTYHQGMTSFIQYSGCTIYGPNGSPTSGACALPREVIQFQTVASDAIYVPALNQILAVSTGALNWTSADPVDVPGYPPGAVAASHVIFVSGTNVLAQAY
jgi:hypothetical protein